MSKHPELTEPQHRWLSVLKLGSGIVSSNAIQRSTARALESAGYIQPHVPDSYVHRQGSRSQPKPNCTTWKVTPDGVNAVEGPGTIPPLAHIGLEMLLSGGTMFDNAIASADMNSLITLDTASEALLAAVTSCRGEGYLTSIYELNFERLRGTLLYQVLDAKTKPRTAPRARLSSLPRYDG